MQQHEQAEFYQIIMSLAKMYNRDLDEFVLVLWWNALKDYDLAVIRKALSAHVLNPDNGQFMPKPADVVRMIGGTSSDKALLAWSKFSEAVRHIGSWKSVVFDDPIIHAVIYEMGGWILLNTKTDKEWDFVRNEFVNRYRSYTLRGEKPEYPPVLIGQFEAHNNSQGYQSEPPCLVGDVAKAEAVMKGGSDSVLQITTAKDYVRLPE